MRASTHNLRGGTKRIFNPKTAEETNTANARGNAESFFKRLPGRNSGSANASSQKAICGPASHQRQGAGGSKEPLLPGRSLRCGNLWLRCPGRGSQKLSGPDLELCAHRWRNLRGQFLQQPHRLFDCGAGDGPPIDWKSQVSGSVNTFGGRSSQSFVSGIVT